MLGFVTIGDPSSMRNWSGAPHFMARALEGHCPGLKRIGPLRAPWVYSSDAIARINDLLATRQRQEGQR